jgi:hypothetical protein
MQAYIIIQWEISTYPLHMMLLKSMPCVYYMYGAEQYTLGYLNIIKKLLYTLYEIKL